MPNNPFNLSENPFVETHDARFVYPSHAHRVAVTRLHHSIENREPFVLVTGLPGVGKTTAIQAALTKTGPYTLVRIEASPSLGHAEFRERILSGFAPDTSDPANAAQAADGIEARLQGVHASGRTALLVVDEAQNLGLPLLEELLTLSNLKADGHALLQTILVGPPVLEETLSRPECEALRQRIAVRCRHGALTAEETESYIRHRVSVAGGGSEPLFTSEACQAIQRLAHGIPREVNLVAGETLALAHTAGESKVTAGYLAGAGVLLGFRSAGAGSRLKQVEAKPVATETVKAAPPAHVDASPPPPMSSSIAPPASARPMGPAVKATPASIENPEVEAWVARFRDPAGPPRIGSRLAVATAVPEVVEPRATEAANAPPAQPESPARPVQPVQPAPPAQAKQPAQPAPPAKSEQPVQPAAPAKSEQPVQPELPASPHHAEPRRNAAPRRRSARADHRLGTATRVAGVLLLLATGALVLATSGRRLLQARPSARATVEAAVAKVDPTPAVTASVARPTLAAVPHAAAPRHTAARATSKPPADTPVVHHAATTLALPPTPTETRHAVAPLARPERRFGVEVATYLAGSRAEEERGHLAARISRPCRVVVTEDGYTVVVGPVASREEAERLGADLSERRLVNEAHVVRWAASDSTRR